MYILSQLRQGISYAYIGRLSDVVPFIIRMDQDVSQRLIWFELNAICFLIPLLPIALWQSFLDGNLRIDNSATNVKLEHKAKDEKWKLVIQVEKVTSSVTKLSLQVCFTTIILDMLSELYQ